MKVNILMSQISLPNTSIGSWNIMFTKLIANKPNLFTHIITPKAEQKISNAVYHDVKPQLIQSHKLQKIFKNSKYKNYFKPLKKILANNNFATINVIDNKNLLIALHKYLVKNKLRDKVRIIYHLHGFDVKGVDRNHFFQALDTFLVLTNTSYQNQVNLQHALSCKVKQIYNGVDTKLFKPISEQEQKSIKRKLGLKNDTSYYLWLSQDRKKKGLHVVLEAWSDFIKDKENVHLIVIGTKDYGPKEQVTFLGRIKNTELPKFYQISTFFIFSTLCHEGHPLALTEALKSGCYCLTSDIDPLSEVLNNGEYGVLVEVPNDPDSWLKSLNITLEDYKINGNRFKIPEELYCIDNWMNTIEFYILEEHNYKNAI